MNSKGKAGTALGAVGVAALLIRLVVKFNQAMRYPDGLMVLGVALLIIALVASPWLAWTFHNARTFKSRLQLDHPGAIVVDTFWTPRQLRRFLKKGQSTSKTKGTGFILDLVADSRGLQLVRHRRQPVYFGLVPWEQVFSVRMEILRKPIGRRPMLVLEIEPGNTPYVAIIYLMPSGRQNKETGMALADMILAKRPRISTPEDR
ncbi:hypothetical protein AB6813_22015 [bacterium RCC_150]